MRIQVFVPEGGWILACIGERIHEADPEHYLKPIVLGKGDIHIPSFEPDGCLYIDVQCVWHPDFRQIYPRATHIGFFTHLDRDALTSFRPGWGRLDGVVQMCQRYLATFIREKWYPADRMIVLRPGEVAHQFPLKKVRIGICQRGGHVGKGSEFLPMVVEALDQEIRDGIEFHFCGKGWNPGSPNLTGREWGRFVYHGIEAIDKAEDNYAGLYSSIDYLLVPSLYEGGPMALLEALSCGIPVIAAEVGWVGDFAREAAVGDLTTFVPGDVEALKAILTGLVAPRLRRRRLVEGMNYKRYAGDLLAFFGRIKEMEQ